MALLAINRKSKNTPKESTANETLPEISPNEILIAESAAKRIVELLNEQGGSILRVGIVGGGCSGFSYHFAVETAPRANDLIFEKDGARICVDPKSLKMIGGSMLEWHEKMSRNGFRLRNKSGAKSCSCGESFSL